MVKRLAISILQVLAALKEVYKGIYVGTDDDVPKAREKGMRIAHVAKDGPHSHRSLLDYSTHAAPKGREYLIARRDKEIYANAIDALSDHMISTEMIDALVGFIREAQEHNEPILVHCNLGKSRSPSIVLLYLMSIGKIPRTLAGVRTFKKLYPAYEPSLGFQTYIRKRLHA